MPSSRDAADGPAMLAVCGPPGVGKTSVAEAAADRLGATLLRTDLVRRELFPDPTYSDAEIERVYTELHDRARERLAAGGRVVLDGTYRTAALRGTVAALAADLDVLLCFLRVTCEETAVRERITTREGASDADFEDHRAIAAAFDPLDRPHTVVDNSGEFERTRSQLREVLADWP